MNTAEVQEKIRQMESPDEEVDLDGDMVIIPEIEVAELQHEVEVANLHHFDVMEDVRKMKEATALTVSALQSQIRDLEIERDLQEEDWRRRCVTGAGLDRLRLRQAQEEAQKDREVEALEAKLEALRKEWSQLRFGDVLQKEAELARDEAQAWREENKRLHRELAALEYEVAWDARETEELREQNRELEGRSFALEQEAWGRALEVQGLRTGNMELGIRLEWLEAKWAEVQASEAFQAEAGQAEALQAEAGQGRAAAPKVSKPIRNLLSISKASPAAPESPKLLQDLLGFTTRS
ncbi:unnamed protein product [Caenorhabditis brenneri]